MGLGGLQEKLKSSFRTHGPPSLDLNQAGFSHTRARRSQMQHSSHPSPSVDTWMSLSEPVPELAEVFRRTTGSEGFWVFKPGTRRDRFWARRPHLELIQS